MKTLPNGLTVFNATPHPVRFWSPDWPEPVEVAVDTVINAVPVEAVVDTHVTERQREVTFVRTTFAGDEAGRQIAEQALHDGADVVVGSIIAAQAYSALVMAMVPAEGFERVPPEQKRMRPDKFTIFFTTF